MRELKIFLEKINFGSVIVREQNPSEDNIKEETVAKTFDNGDFLEEDKDFFNPRAAKAAELFTFG